MDEHPRPQTTIETLTKLKPVFQKDGLVTAGSASVMLLFLLIHIYSNICVCCILLNFYYFNHILFLLQGICDGAGAIILASEEAVKTEGLKPLARLIGYSIVGVEPSIMGIGPAPAIKNLLNLTGKTLDDMELVEVKFLISILFEIFLIKVQK